MKTKSALLCFLLLFAPAAWSIEDNLPPPPPPPPKGVKKPVTQSEYFLFTCKIYINEDGTAKTVEVLSVKPPMDLANSHNKELVKAVVDAALSWTFNPNKTRGKPVAGYAIVPIDVDLAEPFKIGGRSK